MAPTSKPVQSGSNLRALPGAKPTITRDRLRFDTPDERIVYDELDRQRRDLDRFDSFAVATQVPASVPGRTFVLDIVVTSRGRSAVIEVDGVVHNGRWGHDRARDCLFEDARYAFVQRIDARDVQDENALRDFVARFLYRLRERAAG